MTEKEFEQLKVGDKVWIITDWFNGTYGDYQATQLEVKGTECSEFGEDKLVIYAKGRAFRYCDCYLTKSEAWQNEIETMEAIIKAEEDELNEKREKLDRYKAELAKAKEEERRKEWWYVSYKEQTVAKLPLAMDSDAEAEIFETEREAYEALAKYYLEKYYETRRKVEETK